tara:strand:- start:3625 stop:4920 length:1296 start_codon:yes stop_codon:yes gene_type:complete
MSRSAAQASAYENLTLTNRDGRSVNINGIDPSGALTVSFNYYESLLSPNITANLLFVDRGGSVVSRDDVQERVTTISSGLPLSDGNTQLLMRITNPVSGTLDFTRYPLILNKNGVMERESNRESVALNFVSKNGYRNTSKKAIGKYGGRISDSVKRILIEKFDTKFKVDETSNSLIFEGLCDETPYETILELASESVPDFPDANPGYFFYETKDGMNFRSIDKLVSQESKETYTYSGALKSSLEDNSNDFKILTLSPPKTQSIMDLARAGVFKSRNLFTNPITQTCEERIFQISARDLRNKLGKNVEVPDDIEKYCKINHYILDVGTHESGVSTNINNDMRDYAGKSTMRYNILFTSMVDIVVPFNPNLMAGDVVSCIFEMITQDNKNLGSFDQLGSQKYLILHLCHSFSSDRSFTSLTLVRDSFGIYTRK